MTDTSTVATNATALVTLLEEGKDLPAPYVTVARSGLSLMLDKPADVASWSELLTDVEHDVHPFKGKFHHRADGWRGDVRVDVVAITDSEVAA